MRLVCGFVVAFVAVLTLGMIFLPDHAARPKWPVEPTAPSMLPAPRPMLHEPGAAALVQLEPCESVLDRFGGQHGPCMRYHAGERVATLMARPSVSAPNPNPAAAFPPAARRWLPDPKDTVAASPPAARRWLPDPKDTARQGSPPTALQVRARSRAGRPRTARASRNVTASLNRGSAMRLVAPRFTQREPTLSLPAHHPHPHGRSDPPFRRTGPHVAPILQNSRPNQASRQPGTGSAKDASRMGGQHQASPKRLTGSLAARGRGRRMTPHLTDPSLKRGDEACAAKCSGKR